VGIKKEEAKLMYVILYRDQLLPGKKISDFKEWLKKHYLVHQKWGAKDVKVLMPLYEETGSNGPSSRHSRAGNQRLIGSKGLPKASLIGIANQTFYVFSQINIRASPGLGGKLALGLELE